jgi:N6-L-threonylcarbamoyladenine synthase
MILLSIETSCDETAVSLVEIQGDFPQASYSVIGNALFSQIDIHREFGGVFPALAKREHIVTILPMLEKALAESKLPTPQATADLAPETISKIQEILNREPGLADQLIDFHTRVGEPSIDAIAVTSGPGLEPALWVGVNFAKALATLWNIPVIPVDHMEGHILASVFDGQELASVEFPAVALLVSGGHTELLLMSDWNKYEKIGQTRDDAVGEAFDKVARLLGLPYPGGPEVGRMAREARQANLPQFIKLPRPMLDSGDLDFSFSGLKTAVRYAIADKTLSEDETKAIARDFEDAAVESLLAKLRQAIENTNAKSVILGGGVSANSLLRQQVAELNVPTEYPDLNVFLPEISLSTDNSIMIALAGHAHFTEALTPEKFRETIKADGRKSL